MKAIRIHHYGDRSVLRCEDAPEPALHPGDVLIRVHAAGVNPADWQFRRGDFQAIAPMQFPAILGWDVAGIVERVGASARGFRPGDRVYAMCDMGRDGAYAEFIAVQAEHMAPAPAGISLAHCAAVPLAALTAWQALFDLGQLQSGQSVLIQRDGMLIAIAMPPVDPSEAAARGCRGATARVVPDGTRLRKISTMIDAGHVRVLIDSEFPLSEVAAAHARSESRHARGKVLLAVHSRP